MVDRLAFDAGTFLPEDPYEHAGTLDIPRWLERFKDMDRYDWNDSGFLKRNRGRYAFLPIPLSQEFFMIVSRRHYRRMTRFADGSPKRWHVKIDREKETDRILKVYACRHGRKALGEPLKVYASREVTGMIDGKGDVDHVNSETVDNRFFDKEHRINLDYVSTRKNVSNALRFRVKAGNFDLKRGVERRGKNSKGQQLYGGSLRIRRGPKTVDCVRSKRKWLAQEPAHQWYLNQLKRRHGREDWAFAPATVSYAILPPLMESESTYKPVIRSRRAQVHDDSLMATF